MNLETLLELLLNILVAGGIVFLSTKQVWIELKSVLT